MTIPHFRGGVKVIADGRQKFCPTIKVGVGIARSRAINDRPYGVAGKVVRVQNKNPSTFVNGFLFAKE
jgi:hypothetical protein